MTLSSSQSPRRTPRHKFVPSIWLATALIGLYQHHISPYKGFRCAHRVLHGSRSCSSYAKFMIQQQGILGARPHICQRAVMWQAAAAHSLGRANSTIELLNEYKTAPIPQPLAPNSGARGV